jgi:predicted dienelactone hydrolase
LLVNVSGTAVLGLPLEGGIVLPKPNGPYALGRVEADWVDPTRQDSLRPAKNAPRELVIWLWYPAAHSPIALPAAYLPDNWRQAREQAIGPGVALVTQDLAQVRVHAVADAPLAPEQRPFPVLVMQPGLGPIATDYTTLAEDLASQGFVVVFPDGRVARSTPAGAVADTVDPATAKALLDKLVTV